MGVVTKLLSILVVIIGVGIIDTIEDNFVSIELTKSEGAETLIEDISKFPCELKEGDTVIAVDVDGVRVYKCITRQECKKL